MSSQPDQTATAPETTGDAGPAYLGIDVGGSGIKGALVDLSSGKLIGERNRIATPHPATPKAVADVVAQLSDSWPPSPGGVQANFGCTVPGVVKAGLIKTAANIDPLWIGCDAASLYTGATGRNCRVINDADAAGLAELRFGAGAGRGGTIAVITLGTGIGSALFVDGHLVPNTEMGHFEIDGRDAELFAAASVREIEKLKWKEWAGRLNRYLEGFNRLIWPDLIILGGGISKKADKFLPHLHLDVEVVPALLHNDAGIIGAALVASEDSRPTP